MTTRTRIPFNQAYKSPKAFKYVLEALESSHISGDGLFTNKCHDFLEQELGVSKALLTTSCTHALEMSALLLDIQPGDEVIVPSFTFVTTVNAFVLRGAIPVFIDIRPDTLNFDETKLELLITPRTKAIVVVHYAGVGCEMDTIMGVANRHDIPVVEDNAHALFAKYEGRYLGTFGCMATQSFHETKNFSCGEGGALLLNDPKYIERAEIIREKGTDRSKFFRGQVDKYSWVDLGSSYLPSDILAAMLWAHFEMKDVIQKKRKLIWSFYNDNLSDWAKQQQVKLPIIPDYCEQSYHMFYLLMPSLESRSAFISNLKQKEIYSVFHYLPLHLSEMGKRFGGQVGDCPVTEDISDRLVRLPFFADLTAEQLERVVEEVLLFTVNK
jgi:dTDP-4-amino-4,6-dideoxygalactose transaminase